MVARESRKPNTNSSNSKISRIENLRSCASHLSKQPRALRPLLCRRLLCCWWCRRSGSWPGLLRASWGCWSDWSLRSSHRPRGRTGTSTALTRHDEDGGDELVRLEVQWGVDGVWWRKSRKSWRRIEVSLAEV
jgi:hypothetical protein